MYTQIFFVTSVRGMVLPPQMAAKASLSFFGAKMPTPFFFMASAFFLPAAFFAILPAAFFVALSAALVAFVTVVSVAILAQGSSVCALASLDHHDEDDDQGHGQDHEGDGGGDQGDEEGRWQSREEGQWQEDGACHEEEGCRHFRTEEAQRGFGGHLRGQDHAAYRGDEEDLGLHQEELAQPGSHHQAGCEVEGHLPGCEP